MSHSINKPDDKWKPAYYTKSFSSNSVGQNIIDFAELFMSNPNGADAGKPLILTQWQQWLILSLFETKENGLLRYRFGLIGLGRKNGKSLVSSVIALYFLMFGESGGQIYSAAGDRKQASIVFDEVRKQVINNKYLNQHLKVYRDKIENPKTGSFYRVLSSDGDKAHGLNPSLVILDELHIFPSSATNNKGTELFEAMMSGSGARKESLVIGITTAGSNADSLLGKLYNQGIKIANGETEDTSYGFWWWEAPPEADPTDRAAWRAANPNLAEGFIDEEYLEGELKRAEATGYQHFQRLYLNQWVRLQGENFINPHHWNEAKRDETVPLGAEIVIGFDGAISGDCTSLVAMDVNTGLIKVLGLWEPDPQDPNWVTDMLDVDAVVENAFKNYDVKMLWADPAYYELHIASWANRWKGRVERIPASNTRIVPLAQQFITDLTSKDIGHDGNPALTRHVLNAVATQGGSFRKEKKNSPQKIDLLFASVLANGARNAYIAKPKIKRRNLIL